MQALEEPEEGIEALERALRRDSRHRNMITLVREPVETRHFSGSAMGLLEAAQISPGDALAVSDFLSAATDAPKSRGVALRLLDGFRRSMIDRDS